jgi:excisionase family DNA binding protein
MLKVKNVAERLDVSTRTVQVWVNTGKLPAFKVGSVIRIAPEALDAFIAASCPTAKKDQQTGGSATPTPQVGALA